MILKKLLSTLGIGRKNLTTKSTPDETVESFSISIDTTESINNKGILMSTILPNNTMASQMPLINGSNSYWTTNTTAIPTNLSNYNTGTNTIPNVYSVTGTNSYTINTTAIPTIAFRDSNGKEIVRLNNNGTVTWVGEIDVDAAAEAFTRALQLGGELSVGITKGVKQRMRDTIFEEIIEIAKTKGSLTPDDLIYLLQAAKIVDKLKGGYE